MENLVWIITCILIFIGSFVFGMTGMARYINSKNSPKPAPKMPTRNTAYADNVISTATQIYCNYSDSRIIRPGSGAHTKKARYGEAIQEALNLVGAAYQYFDLIDSDHKTGTKKPSLQKVDINDIKIN